MSITETTSTSRYHVYRYLVDGTKVDYGTHDGAGPEIVQALDSALADGAYFSGSAEAWATDAYRDMAGGQTMLPATFYGRVVVEDGCDCEGPLHFTTCWWCTSHDDGRDQATGDPAIDYPEPEPVPAGHPWPKTPSMSRAHFAYLARTVLDLPDQHMRETVARNLAHHLADTNARFDRDRFLTAAGVEL